MLSSGTASVVITSSPSSVLMLTSPFSPAAAALHTVPGIPLTVTVSPSFSTLPRPGQCSRRLVSRISLHFLFFALYFSSTLPAP